MNSAAPLSVVLTLFSKGKEGKRGRSGGHIWKGYKDYTFGLDDIFHVWPNLLFGNNFWNHHNFVHRQSITEYEFFGNKITDYHHPRLYHYRSYYYRLVVLLFSTNTESSITNINYDVLFVSRTVLLPIRYITNKSYYRIDYHRFVLLLNIPIPE